MKQYITALFSLVALMMGSAYGFVPQKHIAFSPVQSSPLTTSSAPELHFPPALQRQRKSMAPVQTMSLFGLGAPELAIILIAAAFVLGPQKLAELGKDAGKIAGELKEVPKEFQKGMAEGEEEALKVAGGNDKPKEEEKK